MEVVKVKKEKKEKQMIYWCFTLPMFPDFWYCDTIVYDIDTVKKKLNNPKVREWIFNVEKGKSGYKHYQGWIRCRSKERFTSVTKILPQAHWEASRGPAAERYASKSDTRMYGPFSFPYRYSGEDIINKLKMWQEQLLRTLLEPADSRKIYWYWDTVGNVGKTAFAKYMCWHHDARLIGGKTADALFAATDGYRSENPIFIVDIPRAQGNKVPYAALEALKNGLGFSSKYESKQYMAPPAHVVVFANALPEWSNLSADRWVINCLDPKEVTDKVPGVVDDEDDIRAMAAPAPNLINLLSLPLNIW